MGGLGHGRGKAKGEGRDSGEGEKEAGRKLHYGRDCMIDRLRNLLGVDWAWWIESLNRGCLNEMHSKEERSLKRSISCKLEKHGQCTMDRMKLWILYYPSEYTVILLTALVPRPKISRAKNDPTQDPRHGVVSVTS